MNQPDLSRRIAQALKEERWEGALPLLEQWCASRPDEIRGWYNRGYCLFRLGRIDDAIGCLERCVTLDPKAENAHKLLAHLRRGRRPQPGQRPVATKATQVAGASADAIDEQWRQGAVVAGRYEIRAEARGGMGVVYMAFDRELQRMVAVKTPLPSALANEDGRARFFREAEAWVALGIHPNICTAYYVQEIGGVPRLFIEYVDGGDLDQWLREPANSSFERRLDIAVQIARGMEHTHGLRWTDDSGSAHVGLVHRDLKPGNVLLSAEGLARVTDFGLVRAQSTAEVESRLGELDAARELALLGVALGESSAEAELSNTWRTVTMAGGVLGTPPYVAPEMWRAAARASTASDLYAFGCMLYELLCGRRPFVLGDEPTTGNRQQRLLSWLKAHVKSEPPDPRRLREGFHDELADLMLALMAKDPGQRPASFTVVRQRLEECYEVLCGRPYPRPRPYGELLQADALNNRGVSFFTLGHEVRAEASWRQATAVDPGHREATFNLGVHEWQRRGLADAELVRRMEEASRGQQPGWRDHHLFGVLHLFLDDLPRARARLQQAAADPQISAEAARDLALVLLALARRGVDAELRRQAVAAVAAARRRAPGDRLTIAASCAVTWLAGRSREAQAEWSALAKADRSLPARCQEAFAALLPGFDRLSKLQPPGEVEAVAVAGDGRVVVRCAGGKLSVWPPTGGRAVGSYSIVPAGSRGRSIAVRGDRLVAGGEGISVAVWELASGRRLAHCPSQPGRVSAVAVAADGAAALTGGSDRVLRVWDLESSTLRAELGGHGAFVSAAAFVPGGDEVVAGCGDGTIHLWDVAAGARRTSFAAHAMSLTAVAVARDGRRMASAAEDGVVRLWSVANAELLRSLGGHHGRVNAVAFADELGCCLSAGDDGTLRAWDLTTGAVLQIMRFPRRVVDLALLADGRRVVVAQGAEAEIVLLQPSSVRRRPLALTLPVTAAESEARYRRFDRVLELANERFIAGEIAAAVSALDDARAVPGCAHHPQAMALAQRVLERQPRQALRSIIERCTVAGGDPTWTVACFAAEDRAILARGEQAPVEVDAVSGERRRELAPHGSVVSSMLVSAGRLWASCQDGSVHCWQLADGGHTARAGVHADAATAVAVLEPQGRWLSAGRDGVLMSGRFEDAGPPQRFAEHSEAVAALAASRDGRMVVAGCWDAIAVVWDAVSGERLRVLVGHQAVVSAVAVSMDCRRVATGSGDGSVRIWDLKSGRQLRVLDDQVAEVSSLDFSPDGRFLVVGDRRGRVQVWDGRSGTCVRTREAHMAAVQVVRFSGDGVHALSAGGDGSLRIWQLDWQPGLDEGGPWDDRARPYLEVFLQQQVTADPQAGLPRWDDRDVDGLMLHLARCGWGRLGRQEVVDQLAGMVSGWGRRQQVEEASRAAERQEQRRQERRAPLKSFAALVAGRRGTMAMVAAAVVAVALLLMIAFKPPAQREASFNSLLFESLRAAHTEEAATRQTPGLVFAFHGAPTLVRPSGELGCVVEARHGYLDLLLHPERYTAAALDPASKVADADFTVSYEQAMICLPRVGDAPIISSLAETMVLQLPEARRQDLTTLMVQFGDRAISSLQELLADPSSDVRHVAAVALAQIRSRAALAALAAAMAGDDDTVVEAATTVLQEVITGGALDQVSATELIFRLADHPDPMIRRNAVYGLALYIDSGPVRALLDRAEADEHPEVQRAARVVRNEIRDSRRQELLGPDFS